MNNQWQQFLKTQAISAVTNTAHQLIDLNHLAILQISGNDAARFLQGQITCDIRLLENQISLPGACCDAKGRILMNFQIWHKDNAYFMLLPNSMLELSIEHLKKYARFSKVSITPVMDPDLSILEITGPDIEKNLEIDLNNLESDLPQKPLSWVAAKECLIIRQIGTLPRFLMIGASEKVIALLQPLLNTTVFSLATINTWKKLNIEAGIVTIYPATSGLLIPQMINLQEWQGISFTKGCYLGQEIIARTQHLGILKRHLHRGLVQGLFQNENDEARIPKVGEEIVYQQESAGIIVESAQIDAEQYGILMVLQDRFHEQMEELRWQEKHLINIKPIMPCSISG